MIASLCNTCSWQNNSWLSESVVALLSGVVPFRGFKPPMMSPFQVRQEPLRQPVGANQVSKVELNVKEISCLSSFCLVSQPTIELKHHKNCILIPLVLPAKPLCCVISSYKIESLTAWDFAIYCKTYIDICIVPPSALPCPAEKELNHLQLRERFKY